MIKLGSFIVLATAAVYVYAAVGIYPYQEKPAEFADQQGCYLKMFNRVLEYNKPYHPRDNKSCLEYTCQTNNNTKVFSCGALGFPEDCHLVQDLTLDHPECCGTVVCDPTTAAPVTTEEPVTDEDPVAPEVPAIDAACGQPTYTPPPCKDESEVDEK